MTIGIIYLGEGILSFAIFNNLFTILLINILNNIITPPPPPPPKKNNNPKLPKVTLATQRKKSLDIFLYLPFSRT